MTARFPLSDDERAQMRQWLENWKVVGPLLEAERWAKLRAMTEAEAWEATRDVVALWQPDWRGDQGEALLLQQRVFRRASLQPARHDE